MHAYSPQKMHMHLRMRAYATETSLLWKLLRTYLESCASIVQAAVCRPPWYCLDEISRPTRNPSKSTHDAIAAAVSHTPHPIIRVGAGVQASSILCMVRTRNVATGLTSSKILFSPFFRASCPQHNIFLQFTAT